MPSSDAFDLSVTSPDWDSLRDQLREVWNRDDLIHAWSDDEIAIPLKMIAAPPSADQVAPAVRIAHEHAAPVYPLGGCTSLDFGLPAKRPGLGLDLSRLNEIVDFPARDMTITVGSGIAIGRLREILAGENQRLPVDIPEDDRATLGGAIATNASGPRRFAFGTLRDYVIGIRAVDGQGTEFKAGGRVVKNVAGYDLCKLLVGSLGTLGVITEVTLKLRPKAETSVLMGAVISDSNGDQLDRLLESLLNGATRPAALEVLNESAASTIREAVKSPVWFAEVPRQGRLLIVGYEGTAAEVHWQRQHLLEQWAGENLSCWDREGDDATPLWQRLIEFPTEPATLTFKANLLASKVADFFRACDPLPIRLASHAGNGIVTGHFGETADVQEAARQLASLRERAVEARGNLVVLRCPPDWKAELAVWGQPRGDWALMERVRRKLDPQGILNPGRFVGGPW